MKYLFVITGIGLGHCTREEAVIKELLNKDKNAKIHIATFGTAYNYFKKRFDSQQDYVLDCETEYHTKIG